LDEGILENARSMVATEDLIADDLLDEIQRTRADITNQHDEAAQLREEIQSLRDDLQARLDKIEDERRDVIYAARRNAEEDLEGFKRELRKMRNDLRSVGMPLEKVNALQEAVEKLSEWTQEPLDEDAIEMPQDIDWIPRVGDTVYLDTLNAEGTIVELDEREAQVQVGSLRVRAGYNDMRQRTRSEKRAAKRGHKRDYKASDPTPPQVESPGLELDLRGQRVDEAIEQLDRYIDAAYTSGLPFGRVIHGKGTGRLRQAVREYVGTHPLISKVTGANPNEGGSGVTVIHMVPLS